MATVDLDIRTNATRMHYVIFYMDVLHCNAIADASGWIALDPWPKVEAARSVAVTRVFRADAGLRCALWRRSSKRNRSWDVLTTCVNNVGAGPHPGPTMRGD
ncbi:hypothetical protein [Xanthomonas fragariae]|uniref:hypothetical protein n=1 Tax=Xanthomonas fragariae TaxID=48664 RepID=UPI00131EE60D|nr:hypothetical protein [Xanthomonas fragariae]MDM7553460.1 hypothetical protein [Xanthomonas fragariae]MDM7556567.1 hypothetical protein [Xanthomonas fragariae]MDM7577384.1 hypothetical protein [Xanthomonas fragariae]MDM7587626.1 hypothetical protein [Xanthomonas fragariae]